MRIKASACSAREPQISSVLFPSFDILPPASYALTHGKSARALANRVYTRTQGAGRRGFALRANRPIERRRGEPGDRAGPHLFCVAQSISLHRGAPDGGAI